MTDAHAPRYSIIFDGKLVAGVSRQTALDNLVHLTNQSEEELLDSLFSVKPVIAAQADNYHLADQFKDKFRHAGLIVHTEAYNTSHDDIVNADLSFGHYAPLKTQHQQPNFIVNTQAKETWQDSDIHQAKGKYVVTFNGQLKKGFNRKQVLANLCSLTNRTEQDVLENVFSTVPVILCQTNNPELASSYHEGFEQAGLVVSQSSNQQIEDPEAEADARSHLLIRDDKPSPRPVKKVQRFTYALYALAIFSCVSWIAIYQLIDNYLKKDVAKSIQVELVQYKPVEKKPPPEPIKKQIVTKPTPVKTKPVEKKVVKKQPPKPVEPPPKPAQPPVEPVKKEQPKPVKKQESKEQQKLKGEYNLQLLTWFAQFQQVNQLESKYAEGEITLRLTIARNGEIKHIEVVKSSSEELQRIVVMQLRKAKTVPGIPVKITGEEYNFDLPLRYRFN